MALSLPYRDSDWFGARFILAIGGGLVVGAFFSVIFGVVSLVRRELGGLVALVVSGSCAALIIWIASIFIADHRAESRIRNSEARLADYRARIRSNPEMGLTERWDIAQDERHRAFFDSFGDPQAAYTEPLLKKIYEQLPMARGVVVSHPACSSEFLATHFEDAYDSCSRGIDCIMLANIAGNSNTPLHLVERVARAEHLPVGAVNPARAALKNRTPDTESGATLP